MFGNLIKVTVLSGGTGDIGLGPPVADGSVSFDDSGIKDKEPVHYAIQDPGNSSTAREVGYAVWNKAANQLTSRFPFLSSAGKDIDGNAIAIDVSTSAYVMCVLLADDVRIPSDNGLPQYVRAEVGSPTFTYGSPGTVNLPGHGLKADDRINLFVKRNKRHLTSLSVANPCVASNTFGHQKQIDEPVSFYCPAPLPSPLVQKQTYYVIAAGFSETEFQFSDTPGGAPIDTSAGTPITQTAYCVSSGLCPDFGPYANGADIQWLELFVSSSNITDDTFEVSFSLGGASEDISAGSVLGTPIWTVTTGNDQNTGLEQTKESALWSFAQAWSNITGVYDTRGAASGILLADGYYPDGISLDGPWVGGGNLEIVGNNTYPGNVVVTSMGAGFIALSAVPGAVTTSGIRIEKRILDIHGIIISAPGVFNFQSIEFGQLTDVLTDDYFMVSTQSPGSLTSISQVSIDGDAKISFWATLLSSLVVTGIIDFFGANAEIFLKSDLNANIYYQCNLSGDFDNSASVYQYDVQLNATIDAHGSTLPGALTFSGTGGQFKP